MNTYNNLRRLGYLLVFVLLGGCMIDEHKPATTKPTLTTAPASAAPTGAAMTAPMSAPMPAAMSAAMAPTTAPSGVRVAIDNFRFDPEVVTVPVGATVTWTNRDDVPHTVTGNTKSFGSGALDTDEKFSHVFTAPGEFNYYCAVHPHMTGRVIVK